MVFFFLFIVFNLFELIVTTYGDVEFTSSVIIVHERMIPVRLKQPTRERASNCNDKRISVKVTLKLTRFACE